MPSIINSDDGVISGTSGLKTTGGNDGVTTFQQNGTERMRITSAGEVLVGGTTEINAADLTVQRTNLSSGINLFRNDTSIASGDTFGRISFYGNDTTSNTPTEHAYIYARASGTHAAGDNPTDLVFGVTPDNTATVTEEMRLTSQGALAFGGAANYGTSGQVLTSQGNASPIWAAAGAPTTQTYDTGTAATWTKPASANWVLIEIWGGGGSGGNGPAASGAGGGGGGAYNQLLVPFASLQGAVTYTVGSGGASQGTTNTAGNTGGTTSVSMASFEGGGTKVFYAYGGAGGAPGPSPSGGGGGGIYSAGGVGLINYGGSPSDASVISVGVGFGGGNGSLSTGSAGYSAVYGGGGGGYGNNSASGAATSGGDSFYGGGGGGGCAQGTGSGGTGGTSVLGGNGGTGGSNGGAPTNGTTPSGGGGGSEARASGAGGSGRVRFTYW